MYCLWIKVNRLVYNMVEGKCRSTIPQKQFISSIVIMIPAGGFYNKLFLENRKNETAHWDNLLAWGRWASVEKPINIWKMENATNYTLGNTKTLERKRETALKQRWERKISIFLETSVKSLMESKAKALGNLRNKVIWKALKIFCGQERQAFSILKTLV